MISFCPYSPALVETLSTVTVIISASFPLVFLDEAIEHGNILCALASTVYDSMLMSGL